MENSEDKKIALLIALVIVVFVGMLGVIIERFIG